MIEVPSSGANPDSGALSRRRLLRAGAGVGALALGGAALLTGTPAQAHGTLMSASEIANSPTYYQDLDTGQTALTPTTFQYQPNLYAKLEEWLQDYFLHTPWSFQAPVYVLLAGTHVDTGSGMHPYGRAADIGGITMYNAVYGTRFEPLNGKWHMWRNDPVHMEEIRRWYWGGVCLLNKYFKWVLHYHFNDIHHNHIHVDNEQSDGTYSTFSTGSRSQVQTVQAACNYIYGMGTAIDGVWGPQTQSHSSTVLYYSGWSGSITSSQNHWHRFLWTAFRAGYGLNP
jgi:hypothetical protein